MYRPFTETQTVALANFFFFLNRKIFTARPVSCVDLVFLLMAKIEEEEDETQGRKRRTDARILQISRIV